MSSSGISSPSSSSTGSDTGDAVAGSVLPVSWSFSFGFLFLAWWFCTLSTVGVTILHTQQRSKSGKHSLMSALQATSLAATASQWTVQLLFLSAMSCQLDEKSTGLSFDLPLLLILWPVIWWGMLGKVLLVQQISTHRHQWSMYLYVVTGFSLHAATSICAAVAATYSFTHSLSATVEWNAGILIGTFFYSMITHSALQIMLIVNRTLFPSKRAEILNVFSYGVLCGITSVGLRRLVLLAATFIASEPGYKPLIWSPLDVNALSVQIACVVPSCLLYLTFLLTQYRYASLRRAENAKHRALTFALLLHDSVNNRVLVNSLVSLPCVIIDRSYSGTGTFDGKNRDFLNMFKTSCDWSKASHDRMLELVSTRKKSAALDLYIKFVNAANTLAADLQMTDLSELGLIFPQPITMQDGGIMIISTRIVPVEQQTSYTQLTNYQWVSTQRAEDIIYKIDSDAIAGAEETRTRIHSVIHSINSSLNRATGTNIVKAESTAVLKPIIKEGLQYEPSTTPLYKQGEDDENDSEEDEESGDESDSCHSQGRRPSRSSKDGPKRQSSHSGNSMNIKQQQSLHGRTPSSAWEKFKGKDKDKDNTSSNNTNNKNNNNNNLLNKEHKINSLTDASGAATVVLPSGASSATVVPMNTDGSLSPPFNLAGGHWVSNVIAFNHCCCMTSCQPGVYLGLLYCRVGANKVEILVSKSHLHMIPMVPVLDRRQNTSSRQTGITRNNTQHRLLKVTSSKSRVFANGTANPIPTRIRGHSDPLGDKGSPSINATSITSTGGTTSSPITTDQGVAAVKLRTRINEEEWQWVCSLSTAADYAAQDATAANTLPPGAAELLQSPISDRRRWLLVNNNPAEETQTNSKVYSNDMSDTEEDELTSGSDTTGEDGTETDVSPRSANQRPSTVKRSRGEHRSKHKRVQSEWMVSVTRQPTATPVSPSTINDNTPQSELSIFQSDFFLAAQSMAKKLGSSTELSPSHLHPELMLTNRQGNMTMILMVESTFSTRFPPGYSQEKYGFISVEVFEAIHRAVWHGEQIIQYSTSNTKQPLLKRPSYSYHDAPATPAQPSTTTLATGASIIAEDRPANQSPAPSVKQTVYRTPTALMNKPIRVISAEPQGENTIALGTTTESTKPVEVKKKLSIVQAFLNPEAAAISRRNSVNPLTPTARPSVENNKAAGSVILNIDRVTEVTAGSPSSSSLEKQAGSNHTSLLLSSSAASPSSHGFSIIQPGTQQDAEIQVTSSPQSFPPPTNPPPPANGVPDCSSLLPVVDRSGWIRHVILFKQATEQLKRDRQRTTLVVPVSASTQNNEDNNGKEEREDAVNLPGTHTHPSTVTPPAASSLHKVLMNAGKSYHSNTGSVSDSSQSRADTDYTDDRRSSCSPPLPAPPTRTRHVSHASVDMFADMNGSSVDLSGQFHYSNISQLFKEAERQNNINTNPKKSVSTNKSTATVSSSAAQHSSTQSISTLAALAGLESAAIRSVTKIGVPTKLSVSSHLVSPSQDTGRRRLGRMILKHINKIRNAVSTETSTIESKQQSGTETRSTPTPPTQTVAQQVQQPSSEAPPDPEEAQEQQPPPSLSPSSPPRSAREPSFLQTLGNSLLRSRTRSTMSNRRMGSAGAITQLTPGVDASTTIERTPVPLTRTRTQTATLHSQQNKHRASRSTVEPGMLAAITNQQRPSLKITSPLLQLRQRFGETLDLDQQQPPKQPSAATVRVTVVSPAHTRAASSSASLTDIKQAMISSGLFRDYSHLFLVFPSSATGKEIVDWLITSQYAAHREQAVMMAKTLMLVGLHPTQASNHRNTVIQSGNNQSIEDDTKLYSFDMPAPRAAAASIFELNKAAAKVRNKGDSTQQAATPRTLASPTAAAPPANSVSGQQDNTSLTSAQRSKETEEPQQMNTQKEQFLAPAPPSSAPPADINQPIALSPSAHQRLSDLRRVSAPDSAAALIAASEHETNMANASPPKPQAARISVHGPVFVLRRARTLLHLQQAAVQPYKTMTSQLMYPGSIGNSMPPPSQPNKGSFSSGLVIALSALAVNELNNLDQQLVEANNRQEQRKQQRRAARRRMKALQAAHQKQRAASREPAIPGSSSATASAASAASAAMGNTTKTASPFTAAVSGLINRTASAFTSTMQPKIRNNNLSSTNLKLAITPRLEPPPALNTTNADSDMDLQTETEAGSGSAHSIPKSRMNISSISGTSSIATQEALMSAPTTVLSLALSGKTSATFHSPCSSPRHGTNIVTASLSHQSLTPRNKPSMRATKSEAAAS